MRHHRAADPRTRGNPSRTGFTLIELLSVVAIIGILAAIAIPNFLEAQIRSKTARVRMELMGLKLAVGDYYTAWGAYPAPLRIPEKQEEPARADRNRRVLSLEEFAEANRSYMVENASPASATAPQAAPPAPVPPPAQRPPGWLFPFTPAQPPGSDDPWEMYPSPLCVLTTPVAFVPDLPHDPYHRSILGYGPYKYHPHLGEEGEGLLIDVPGHRGSFLFTLWSYGPDLVGDAVFTPDLIRLVVYDPTNGTTSSGELLLSGP